MNVCVFVCACFRVFVFVCVWFPFFLLFYAVGSRTCARLLMCMRARVCVLVCVLLCLLRASQRIAVLQTSVCTTSYGSCFVSPLRLESEMHAHILLRSGLAVFGARTCARFSHAAAQTCRGALVVLHAKWTQARVSLHILMCRLFVCFR